MKTNFHPSIFCEVGEENGRQGMERARSEEGHKYLIVDAMYVNENDILNESDGGTWTSGGWMSKESGYKHRKCSKGLATRLATYFPD